MAKQIDLGWTYTPNIVFDEYVPQMKTLEESKVFFITLKRYIEKLQGINKADLIELTGLSSKRVNKGIDELIEKRWIKELEEDFFVIELTE